MHRAPKTAVAPSVCHHADARLQAQTQVSSDPVRASVNQIRWNRIRPNSCWGGAENPTTMCSGARTRPGVAKPNMSENLCFVVPGHTARLRISFSSLFVRRIAR